MSSKAHQEKIIAELRAQGYRLTPQRVAVIKTLIGNREHPSVEQIHDRVRTDFPMTSLATVYKTVALLEGMGVIQELCFKDTSSRYDGGSPDPHPHLVCTECKGIADVNIAGLRELYQDVAQRSGYRIESYRFDLFGICPRCQQDE
ncbi:MAG: transcriptional repressor [Ardenticatenales bacterium]|nr:transcriptional repressor [Ardenticatenales bacterium]